MSLKQIQGLALAGCLAAWAQAGWTPTGPYGGEAEIVRSVPGQPGLVIAATRNGLFYSVEEWRGVVGPSIFSSATVRNPACVGSGPTQSQSLVRRHGG